MKRFLPLLVLTIAGLGAFAASAEAVGGPNGGGARHMDGAGHMHGVRRFHRCIASLNLTADQKTAIHEITSASRATIQADREALRADRQKIRADVDAGADKAAIGQDVLTAHAAGVKLKADAQAVRDEALAKLTPDQQSQAKACLQAPARRRGDSQTR